MKWSRLFLAAVLTYLLGLQFTSVECKNKKKNKLSQVANALNAGCPGDAPLIRNGTSPNGDSPTEPLENMVSNAGYASETYTTETKDGYILSMFRICKKGKKSKKPKCSKGTPVLIVHGLLSSPNNWIINDKNKALPYKLVEDGKDVWLAANRGTTYSQRHKTLSTKDPRFWEYSHVELGLYDVPAFLDKIQDVTKQSQVFYIGHSLGTKQYFTLMSLFPQNCSRIKAMWALAPVAYLKNQKSVPLQLLATAIAPLGVGTTALGGLEFLPSNQAVKTATSAFCATKIGCPVCEEALFSIMGYNPKQVNAPWQPTVLGHIPDVTSTKCLIHNAQEVLYDRFGFIDYGIVENPIRYGKEYTIAPPQFNVSNIKNEKSCKIHLVYSDNDYLADTKDVLRLNKEMGSAVKSIVKVADKGFNHFDFLFGKDADTLVYNKILKEMKRYK